MLVNHSGYRKAFSVELYDAGVIIRSSDHDASHDASGFVDGYDLNGFVVSGSSLLNLASLFGIETYAVYTEGARPRLKDSFELGLTIARQTENYLDGPGCHIDAILARVDGPQMLSLKIQAAWTEQDGSKKEFLRQHTYCGAFGVEWVSDSDEILGG